MRAETKMAILISIILIILISGHFSGKSEKKISPHYTKCLELEIGKDKCNQIFNEKK